MGINRDYRLPLSDIVDIRTGFEKFSEEVLSKAGFINAVAAIYLISGIAYPAILLLGLLPLLSLITAHIYARKDTYPNRLPIYVKNWVAYTPKLKSMAKRADGVVFVGNVYNPKTGALREEVWESVDQSCIHRLVATGTGGGKTTSILSSFVSLLSSWGHTSMNDGKGENKTARMIAKIMRGWALDDDLRNVNFMTSNAPEEAGYLRSHQLNLYADNDAAAVVELFNGLIGSESGQNKVFQERATILGDIATRLVFDRSAMDPRYVKTLSAMTEYLNVPQLLTILNSPASTKDPGIAEKIKVYLQSLQVADDVTLEDWFGPEYKEARRQHLFCQMYFTKALLTLTHTYGYIFNVEFGDFTWRDVTNNKRHVYQLLPAIDKSKSEMKFLAEVASQLRLSATKRFLGSRIQGRKYDTGELNHNRSISLIISDEHFALMTKDDPTLLAQLRSMRFAMQLFMQSTEYGRAIDKETMVGIESIVGVLQVGRTADKSSIDRIKDLAGKRLVAVANRLDGRINALGSRTYYRDNGASLEKREVITDDDIITQGYGQVHMAYVGEKDNLSGKTLVIPVQLFYLGKEAADKIEAIDDVVLAHLVKPVEGSVPSSIIQSDGGETAIQTPEAKLTEAPEEERPVTVLTKEGFLEDVPAKILDMDERERIRLLQQKFSSVLFEEIISNGGFKAVVDEDFLDGFEEEMSSHKRQRGGSMSSSSPSSTRK